MLNFHLQSLMWYVGFDVEIVLQKQGATIGSVTIQILKKKYEKIKNFSAKILRSGICGSFFSCSEVVTKKFDQNDKYFTQKMIFSLKPLFEPKSCHLMTF